MVYDGYKVFLYWCFFCFYDSFGAELVFWVVNTFFLVEFLIGVGVGDWGMLFGFFYLVDEIFVVCIFDDF